MIRWISLAFAVIVLTAAVPLVYYSLPEGVPEPTLELHRTVEGPPPKVEVVGPKLYSFGAMGMKIKGTHSWEFKNLGVSPLEVWLEETSCSCTVAKLKTDDGEVKKKVVVPPGQSTPIEVTWEGSKAGRFGQSATLGTNDPDNPRVVVSVVGRMVPSVDVLPAETIVMPEISNEESHRETLTITSLDRPDLKLTKLASSKPGLIVAEAKPLSREDLDRLKVASGYTLTVEVKPGLPLGRFTEDLVIETDDPKRPELKLTVVGDVAGPIRFRPDRVQLPIVASRKGGSKSLSIVVRDGKETHFEVVRKPERVDVAVTGEDKPESKGRYRLTVTVPPGLPPGLIDDPIVLKTDHPKVGEITLPVLIIVSSRDGSS